MPGRGEALGIARAKSEEAAGGERPTPPLGRVKILTGKADSATRRSLPARVPEAHRTRMG